MTVESPSARGNFRHRPSVRTAFLAAVAAGTLLLSLWTHLLAGFSFPVPWDDEAIFFYPAAAVGESWTIRTDSLNTERPVYYHPPGYPVALGLFFRLVPASLRSARFFSWLLMAAAYLAGMGLLRNFRCRPWASALWSLFFLNAHCAIAGNVARPEALVVALALAGFWLLLVDRPWRAASVLGLACLVHPAAWFPAMAAAAAFLREHGRRWPAPSRRDWPWLAFAAGCALAMAAHLALRWEWVWNDLQVGIQFLHQTWPERLAGLLRPRLGIPALVAFALPVAAFRAKRPLFDLSLLGLAFWFLQFYRPEMWYFVYTSTFYALAAIVLLELAARFLPPAALAPGLAAVAAALVLVSYLQGYVPDPRHFPRYLWWRHMTIRTEPAYLHPADVHAVPALRGARGTASAPALFQFPPGPKGALFHRRLPSPWIPFYPSFTQRRPDAVVVHVSRLAFPGFNQSAERALERLGMDPAAPGHVRDQTEKWFVAFPPPSPPGGDHSP